MKHQRGRGHEGAMDEAQGGMKGEKLCKMVGCVAGVALCEPGDADLMVGCMKNIFFDIGKPTACLIDNRKCISETKSIFSRKLALASWSCSCFSKLSDGVDAPQKPQIID